MKKIIIFLCLTLCFACFACSPTGTSTYEPRKHGQLISDAIYYEYEQVDFSEKEQITQAYLADNGYEGTYSVKPLYSIDSVQDFVLVEFETTGYMIFFSLGERVFLIEENLTTESPYSAVPQSDLKLRYYYKYTKKTAKSTNYSKTHIKNSSISRFFYGEGTQYDPCCLGEDARRFSNIIKNEQSGEWETDKLLNLIYLNDVKKARIQLTEYFAY